MAQTKTQNRTLDRVKRNPGVDKLREDLREIELDVLTGYTLADAIREGSSVTDKATTWEDDGKVCAMSAAVVAAQARGYLK